MRAWNPVLVIYGTTEGQTRKIAEFVADAVRVQGIDVETVDSAAEAATKVRPVHVAAIVCGSVHQQRYQSSLLHFVRHNRAWLAGIPTAFISVSMTAVLNDGQSRAELRKVAEGFYGETGWTPRLLLQVAGALRYTQNDFFKRLVMKLIVKYQGGDPDTFHDHEYTDWNALTRFVGDFLADAKLTQPPSQRGT